MGTYIARFVKRHVTEGTRSRTGLSVGPDNMKEVA
jgi:hypothetical protein